MVRYYNVAFSSKIPSMGGGIADVGITPTESMLMNEARAAECEHSALVFRNLVFEEGYHVAREQFFAQNPELV